MNGISFREFRRQFICDTCGKVGTFGRRASQKRHKECNKEYQRQYHNHKNIIIRLMKENNWRELAERFHDTYERLAPNFGYETREDTKSFDPESKNGKLVIAVCEQVMKPLLASVREETEREVLEIVELNVAIHRELEKQVVGKVIGDRLVQSIENPHRFVIEQLELLLGDLTNHFKKE